MKILTKAPKDKSLVAYIYSNHIEKEVKASKFYVVLLSDGSWEKGHYIHCRKQWLDDHGCRINNDKIVGYLDIESEIKQ